MNEIILNFIRSVCQESILTAETENQIRAFEYIFFNDISDLSYILDEERKICAVNNGAATRFKTTVKEMVGRTLREYLNDSEYNFRKAFEAIAMSSPEPIGFEERIGEFIFRTSIRRFKLGNKIYLCYFSSDITNIRQNDDTVFKYNQIFSTLSNPIIIVDIQGTIPFVNRAFLKLMNLDTDKLTDSSTDVIKDLNPGFYEILSANLKTCLLGEEIKCSEWIESNNTKKYVLTHFKPIKNKVGTYNSAVLICTNLTENKVLEEKLKKISVTDPLTGIFNRAKLYKELEKEINRIYRFYTHLSVLMFDIDHFKSINDSFGHDVGDEVLKTITSLVKKSIRTTDTFSRWGGEEFMIILPLTSLELGKVVAEKIRLLIQSNNFKDVGKVTCSFGVTQYIEGEDSDSLLKRVDEALYMSKETGRNKTTTL